jgi:hypothetical protein
MGDLSPLCMLALALIIFNNDYITSGKRYLYFDRLKDICMKKIINQENRLNTNTK